MKTLTRLMVSTFMVISFYTFAVEAKKIEIVNVEQGITQVDLKLSDAISSYWTNVTKFGNPNGNNLLKWPAFSDKDQKVMYFQKEPTIGVVPNRHSLEVLDQYFQWRRTEEGKTWANK